MDVFRIHLQELVPIRCRPLRLGPSFYSVHRASVFQRRLCTSAESVSFTATQQLLAIIQFRGSVLCGQNIKVIIIPNNDLFEFPSFSSSCLAQSFHSSLTTIVVRFPNWRTWYGRSIRLSRVCSLGVVLLLLYRSLAQLQIHSDSPLNVLSKALHRHNRKRNHRWEYGPN